MRYISLFQKRTERPYYFPYFLYFENSMIEKILDGLVITDDLICHLGSELRPNRFKNTEQTIENFNHAENHLQEYLNQIRESNALEKFYLGEIKILRNNFNRALNFRQDVEGSEDFSFQEENKTQVDRFLTRLAKDYYITSNLYTKSR